MERPRTDRLSRPRNVILALLLAMAAAAWASIASQGAGADMVTAMAAPTMGLRAPMFLAVWAVMMAMLWERNAARVTAAALLAYEAVVLLAPRALPIFTVSDGMAGGMAMPAPMAAPGRP